MTDAALTELLTLTVEVNSNGTTYRNHLGQRHRILGPAVITVRRKTSSKWVGRGAP